MNFKFIIHANFMFCQEVSMNQFKDRLKELRLAKGITQKSMGERLGITTRAYQFYESGERYPDFQGLLALADYFQVPLDYLVGRSDKRRRLPPSTHR